MFDPKGNLVDVTEQYYVLILINAFQVQSQTDFFFCLRCHFCLLSGFVFIPIRI